MARVWLLVLAVLALWWWLRGRRVSNRPASGETPEPAASTARGASESKAVLQAMVRCAHCGLHLPQGDALAQPDEAAGETHFYCSPAHRAQGPAQPAAGKDAP